MACRGAGGGAVGLASNVIILQVGPLSGGLEVLMREEEEE